MINKFKTDSIIYFFGKLIPSFVNFISIGIFIRFIGPEEYGKYALLITLILLIGNVCYGWICQGIIRFSSSKRTHEEKEDFIATVFFSSLYSMSFGIFFVSLIVFFFIKNSFSSITLITAVLFFLFLYTVRMSMAQTELNSHKVLLTESVRVMVVLSFPVVLFYSLKVDNYKLPLYGVLLGYLIGWVLLCKGDFGLPRKTIKSDTMKQFWAYGWPMTLWFCFSLLLNVSDRYLIGYFIDLKAVGVYSAVYDISYKSFSLLLTPILTAAHPLVTHMWNSGDRMGTVSTLNRAVRYQFFIFLMTLPLLYLFSPLIVKLILGKDDPIAASIVVPVAVGSFLWQISMLIHKPLELELQTKTMVIFVGIALLCNIIGNVLFIPRFGFIAAAYTTIAGSVVYLALVMGYCKRMIFQYGYRTEEIKL